MRNLDKIQLTVTSICKFLNGKIYKPLLGLELNVSMCRMRSIMMFVWLFLVTSKPSHSKGRSRNKKKGDLWKLTFPFKTNFKNIFLNYLTYVC